MSPHLKYAKYVARHKWFVLVAGRRTKAPLWRLLIHDWSKLAPAEWSPYVAKFYGPLSSDPHVKEAFDAAWLHHQHRNAHHWQHHVLRRDDSTVEALEMPLPLVREMVADWMGAGRAITGRWEVGAWYAANCRKMRLHPSAVREVERLLGMGA